MQLVDLGANGMIGGGDDTAIDTEVTGVDGSYSFTDVPPGNFAVIETDLSGYFSVSDDDAIVDGGDGGDDTNDYTLEVALIGGESDTGNDFLDEQHGEISGTVTDPNAVGIEDVTIELWEDTDGNGTPDVLVVTTMTGVAGTYSFNL